MGARLLDLFAGSGAVGLEALSRGAASAVFVESGRVALRALRENLRLAPAGRARAVESDASVGLARLAREGARFDLLFADPPYEAGLDARLGELAAAVAVPEASLAFEHRSGPAAALGGWTAVESRRYGDSALTLFVRAEA